MKLLLKRVGRKEATEAITQWHYSRKVNQGAVNYGVWEDDRFIGVVCFGQSATPHIATPFGLQRHEVRELVRVALDNHQTSTTRIVSIALRLFQRDFPAVKLVVSFADTAQHHNGTIYQAGNWLYLGERNQSWYRVAGTLVHPKTLYSRYGKGGQSIPWLREHIDPQAERVKVPPKHKYVYSFDSALREQWQAQAKPYPKKCASMV